MDNYDALKLDYQLCFPLYAAAREAVKLYRPHLEKLNLTYTQYITMLVLWEGDKVCVKDLGARLFLDSGTLTPVLKSLESKGYLRRYRSDADERVLIVELTKEGRSLRKRAIEIPQIMSADAPLDRDETIQLYTLLRKMLRNVHSE